MTIKYKTILFYGLPVFCSLLFFSGKAQNEIGINTLTPKSDFEINGSFAKKVTVVTTSTSLDQTHSIVICNNATTAITISLPAVTSCAGRVYTIKKGTSTADITIDANGSETIDGALTLVLSDQYRAETLISDGTEWKRDFVHLAPYPMGEISFFSVTGTAINIINQTTDGGVTNMYIVSPATTFTGRGEFDNGGSDNGRLRYIGKNVKTFHIACTISGTMNSSGAAASTLVFAIAKNGTIQVPSKILNRFAAGNTDVQSTSLHLMITMSPNDYLELYIGNTTNSSNFSFRTINLFALGMD